MKTLSFTLSCTMAACSLFWIYYVAIVTQKPRVHAGNSKLRRFLRRHVPILKTKYYPTPFLWDGRLQTMLAQFQRVTDPPRIPYSRELFLLSDGGEVALDYMMLNTSSSDSSEKPLLVLLLPGLTSSSQATYIRTIVQSINKAGASVVVLNHRGCGGVPYKSPRTHSACYIGDVEEVAPYIGKRFSDYRIIALGTSLGGIVFSKYVICHPEEAKKVFECIIIISIMWNGHLGTKSLNQLFINKYVINRALGLSLVKLWQKFLATYADPPFPCDVNGGLAARTLTDFDVAVSTPQFGYANVSEYYDTVTSAGQVHKYSIPVFAINAEDDPAQPGNSLPIHEAEESSSKLALIVTTRGGHLGWLEGLRRKSEHYVERVVGELVQAIRIYGKKELGDI